MIDLLSNTVWSDSDITDVTEARVHQSVSQRDEIVLLRKLIGKILGAWELSPTEEAAAGAYMQACLAAHAAGTQARADNALLQATLDHEAAVQRLAQPPIEDDELDILEREAAEAIIDAASPEVLELFARRVAV